MDEHRSNGRRREIAVSAVTRHRIVPALVTLTALACWLSPVWAQEWVYTLRADENPWTIAERHLRSVAMVDRLVQLNRITDPHGLPPGTKLRIPVSWLKSRPATAELVAKSGDVFRVDGRGEEPAELAQRLGLGEGLRTETESSATVRFADATRFVIGPQSTVWFDEVRSLGGGTMVDIRARLAEGSIRSERIEGAPTGRQEIRTPQGVAAVRGTVYRVRTETAATTTEVLRGRVALRGERAAGRTADLAAGRGTIVPDGGDPLPPRALLPAPQLAAGAERLDRVPIRLVIEPVPGAAAYRLEVAEDAAFTRVVAARRATGPLIVGPDIVDGNYFIRVRAIDADGIEGLDREAPITLDARPEPPALLEPRRDGKVRQDRPTFRWAELSGAPRYRLQVATDVAFATTVIDREVGAAAEPVTDALPEGRYWWRVATRDATGDLGPFGDVQTFERKDPPPAPTGSEIADDAGPPVLSWREAVPGASYRVQIARDAKFEGADLVDRTVSEPRLELGTVHPGTYYLRIATLVAGEEPGPFGPTQKVEVPAPKWWPALLLPWALVFLAVL